MAKTHLLLMVAAVLLLPGCGSGGAPGGDLAGAVTDVDGNAVAGATVYVGSNQTRSLQNGSFILRGVGGGYQTVHATATIGGHTWSGQTVVDVTSGDLTRTVTVVISDERFQGSIAGTVIDPNGFAIEGAKVFVGQNAGSTLAVTDRNGNYQVDHLPSGVTYTVTASAINFLNDTKQVHVDANLTSAASFALTAAGFQGTIPPPTSLVAQSWTQPSSISRADDLTRSFYDGLRRFYRRKKGLPDGPVARSIERKNTSRSWPANAMIEVDLFWSYQNFTDLLGYAIDRGRSTSTLAGIALLRDPLAAVFFDADPALSPDVTYYYDVRRLDTVGFPNNGAEGAASPIASATPFQPIHAQSPSGGQTIAGNPLFVWTSVPGAAQYQVFLFDRFPDLRSSTDPNGVVSIWTGGSSTVNAPATSTVYDGPALVSGHTYYWTVVASDAAGDTYSASEIARFTVR
ncbi:MAG: carboxypeptidase regulatory-like domain-containing protein [Chthonomonadales bacterium]